MSATYVARTGRKRLASKVKHETHELDDTKERPPKRRCSSKRTQSLPGSNSTEDAPIGQQIRLDTATQSVLQSTYGGLIEGASIDTAIIQRQRLLSLPHHTRSTKQGSDLWRAYGPEHIVPDDFPRAPCNEKEKSLYFRLVAKLGYTLGRRPRLVRLGGRGSPGVIGLLYCIDVATGKPCSHENKLDCVEELMRCGWATVTVRYPARRLIADSWDKARDIRDCNRRLLDGDPLLVYSLRELECIPCALEIKLTEHAPFGTAADRKTSAWACGLGCCLVWGVGTGQNQGTWMMDHINVHHGVLAVGETLPATAATAAELCTEMCTEMCAEGEAGLDERELARLALQLAREVNDD